MKKITFFLSFLILTGIMFAQAPNAFKYQAIARDVNGDLIANQNVGILIKIIQSSTNGVVKYAESHLVTTNQFGLIDLEIGNGTIVSGIFSSINWAQGPYFLRVEMDVAGGTAYQLMGVSQLLAVPYALYAEKSGSTTQGQGIMSYTQFQIDTLTANPGTMVYNTTTNCMNFYNGSVWTELCGDPPCTPWPTNAIAGPEQWVYGTTTTLAANTPVDGIGQWSYSGGTINEIGNPNSLFSGDPGQTYLLYWTINTFCGASTDSVYINFVLCDDNNNCTYDYFSNGNCYFDPIILNVANAGPDQSVFGTAAVLAGNAAVSGGTGVWSKISGTGGSFSNTLNPQATFTGLDNTEYLLKWKISDSCWTSSDTVKISFSTCDDGDPCTYDYFSNGTCYHDPITPTVAVAGDNQLVYTIAATGSTSLLANEAVIGTGTWSVLSGTGGTFDDPSNHAATFTGNANETYSLQWQISHTCDTTTDDLTVTFTNCNDGNPCTNDYFANGVCHNDPILPTAAFAGNDQTVNGTSTTLDANTPSFGTGLWYVVSGTNPSFSSVSEPHATFSGNNGTQYILTWVVNSPCGSSIDTVIINFFNCDDNDPCTEDLWDATNQICTHTPIVVPVANAGADQLNVPGPVTLAGNSAGPGTGSWSIWDGMSGSIADPSDPQSSFSGIIGNSYILVWTIAHPCSTTTDTVIVSIGATFVCGTTLLDTRDNQTYNTVDINGRCWMAENLNYGDFVTTAQGQANNSIAEKFGYSNDPLNCATKGGLYTWDELMQYSTADSAQGLCPTGWYIPTDSEWYEMENFVDNTVNDPTAINYRGTDIQLKLIDGGSSGLDLIYSGVFYAPNGNFFGGGASNRFGVYATSTENSTKAWMRTIHENNTGVSRTSDFKSLGISVRCIKSGPSTPPCSPQPSQANAGSDQVNVTGTSATLDATPPTSGTGQWSVWSGQGGTLSVSSLANSSFTGIPGQAYELTWTVSTACGSNSDNVLISFMDTSVNTFSCGSAYTDTRDNKTYNTVEINGRCWMAQNLNYGTAVTPAEGQSNNSIAEKYCYNNDPTKCDTRGGLYTWNEMMDYSTADSAQGLCPSGWHIPSDAEWYEMENFVDTSVNDPTYIGYQGTDIHTKLMQGGSSGLDLIYTGTYYQPLNVFYGGGNINRYSNYATSTESGTDFWIRTIAENNIGVSRDVLSKLWGNPVRCINDDSAPPCSPQPSQANAGPDQLDMPGASITLAAELPTSGIGQWSIVSGQNGSFSNTALNTSTFTGTTGQVYQLAWTISTACGSSSDEVSVSFVCLPMPTTADAGPDVLNVLTDSVILAANLPLEGTGQWSVVSGQGGLLSNSSLFNSTFTGIPGQAYELTWTISTVCGSSSDNVAISFMDTATVICGTSLLDTRDNQTYDIVEINGRCWFTKNLNYGNFMTTTQGQSNNSIAEKFCYSNDPLNCTTKGGLYTWNELMEYSTADSAQGLCPSGWHVPSDGEWFEMENFVDNTVNDPTAINYRGTDIQLKLIDGGSTGLDLIYSGVFYAPTGNFFGGGASNRFGVYATSTENSTNTWMRTIGEGQTGIKRSSDPKSLGISVRCIKDEGGAPPCSPQPSQSNAGSDQINVTGTSVTLNATTPSAGTGQWSVATGQGGTISNSSLVNSTFSGIPGQAYELTWTVSTVCGSSSDNVTISFMDTATVICGTSLLDTRDNQTYDIVEINGRCWFAKNLNYGDFVTTTQGQANNSIVEKFCYSNDSLNCATKGGLYTWDELMQYSTTDSAQGLCPTGWYIPTDAEWYEMENFVDNTVNDPAAINYRGTDIQLKLIDGGSTGLDLIYSGVYYAPTGNFFGGGSLNRFGVYATSTENSTKAWMRTINENNTGMSRTSDFKSIGISVRCIQEEGVTPPCSPLPSQANAGADQLNIVGTSTTLNATSPSVGTGQWSIASGSGGSFSNSASNTSTFFGVAGETYQLTWTVSNSCGYTSDQVAISFYLCSPLPSQANAGSDQLNIVGTSTTLNATSPSVGTGQWSIASGTGGSFSNSSANYSTFNGVAGETYQLTWTVSNNCGSTSDQVEISFYLCSPQPSQANAGVDQLNVVGTSVTMSANVPAQGTGQWSITSGSGGYFSNPFSNSSTFNGVAGQSYLLTWTISNNCGSTNDQVAISFYLCSPQPTANAGADILNVQIDSVVLGANIPPSPGTGLWTINSGTGGSFSDATSNTSVFYGPVNESYELVWTVTTACGSASDMVTISFVFACGSPLIDTRDNQEYNTLQFGAQCWMASSLNYGTYVPISAGASQANPVAEKFCYDNLIQNCDTFGAMYSWAELMNYTTQEGTQGLCPPGWHIPSDYEWYILENYLDATVIYDPTTLGWRGTDVGTKLKLNGSSGMDLRLSGQSVNTQFLNLGIWGYYATSTTYPPGGTSGNVVRKLESAENRIKRTYNTSPYTSNVRCLKN